MTATPPPLPIGTVGFDGTRAKTFAKLDVVEVQDTFRGVPGASLLRKLRRQAGDAFTFVLRAPLVLSQPADAGKKRPGLSYLPEGLWPQNPLDTGEAGQAAWAWTVQACEAIGARAMLLQTSSRFRPTAANRRRMAAFFEQVASVRPARILWDGQGLWSTEERAALCRNLDLVPCLDPLVESVPPGGEAYLRVLGRSRSPHGLSADELDLLDDALSGLAWGAAVMNTPNPFRDASALKKLASL